jgi:hypothetical protein
MFTLYYYIQYFNSMDGRDDSGITMTAEVGEDLPTQTSSMTDMANMLKTLQEKIDASLANLANATLAKTDRATFPTWIYQTTSRTTTKGIRKSTHTKCPSDEGHSFCRGRSAYLSLWTTLPGEPKSTSSGFQRESMHAGRN